MGKGGIYPHSACRYGHLSGVTHGFVLRALSLRDDVSPFGRVPSFKWRFVSAHSPALMSGATTNIIFHASHIALDVIVSMRIIDNYIHYILFQQVFSD